MLLKLTGQFFIVSLFSKYNSMYSVTLLSNFFFVFELGSTLFIDKFIFRSTISTWKIKRFYFRKGKPRLPSLFTVQSDFARCMSCTLFVRVSINSVLQYFVLNDI